MAQELMKHKGYAGTIEASIEDGCLHGRISFIDDIITYEGQTIPELMAAFVAAVERYLEHCERVGAQPNKPYSGSFNVRTGSDVHRAAAHCALARGETLNEYVTRAIDAANRQGIAAPAARTQLAVQAFTTPQYDENLAAAETADTGNVIVANFFKKASNDHRVA